MERASQRARQIQEEYYRDHIRRYHPELAGKEAEDAAVND